MKRLCCLLLPISLLFSCGKKDDDKEDAKPGPTREESYQVSLTQWESIKQQRETYTYIVVFAESTGKKDESFWLTRVAVKDGKLLCRIYKHSSGIKWVEEGMDINSHADKGATARTIDDIYRNCRQELNIHANSLYLHFSKENILLGCNNQCGNNCYADEIPFSEPQFGVADCSLD